MTVKELIQHLTQFDPETEVVTSITDHTDYVLTLSLESEEVILENELYGDNVYEDFEDKFDEEADYKGKPVLMIKLEC
jgi:hypothetical protein